MALEEAVAEGRRQIPEVVEAAVAADLPGIQVLVVVGGGCTTEARHTGGPWRWRWRWGGWRAAKAWHAAKAWGWRRGWRRRAAFEPRYDRSSHTRGWRRRRRRRAIKAFY